MGCVESTAAVPKMTKGTAETQAVAQLKLLFEKMDMDSDQTLDRSELQMALQKNHKLGALIAQAKLNPDPVVLELLYTNKAKLKPDSIAVQQLDTNEDGRVSWEEFESHLKQAATERVKNTGGLAATQAVVEETAVEEKAEARLRDFKLIASNKDDILKAS